MRKWTLRVKARRRRRREDREAKAIFVARRRVDVGPGVKMEVMRSWRN